LASADATLANEIRVVNIDATNTVTVETEGSETIDPNAEASKSIANAGWVVAFVSDGSNWDTTLAGEFESVTTDQLVIGGTLFEEDSNSPINVSSTPSTNYTVGNDYDYVVVLPEAGFTGFDELQVNGGTNGNYDVVDNSDTKTTGATEFLIPYATWSAEWLHIIDSDSYVHIRAGYARDKTGQTVGGRNTNIGGSGINQFTLSDSGGDNRSLKARVYGRAMSI